MAFAGLGGGLWLGLGATKNDSLRRENEDLLEISQVHQSAHLALEAELNALLDQIKLWPDLSAESLARAFQISRVDAWLEVAKDGTIQKSLMRASMEPLASDLSRSPRGVFVHPAQPRVPYLVLRQHRTPEIETVLVISPQSRFALFRTRSASSQRHLLIESSGRVLAHTQKELVGADLSSSDLGLRIRRESTGRASLKTLEGVQSNAAWSPLKESAALLATERVLEHKPTSPFTSLFGKGLLILGSLSFLGLVFSRFASADPAPTIAPALEAFSEAKAFAKAQINAHQEQTKKLQALAPKPRVIPSSKKVTPPVRKVTAQDLVARFEHQSRTLYEQTGDLRLVWSLLCETSAQLCASPVLYFRFEPQSRTLYLETDAGFSSERAPAAAAFPLSLAALESISTHATQGARISLADYAPLQKLLLDRLGVACFEAWGLMGGPRLIGVLVILQTNSQTEMHREHVFRMMGTILRLGSTPRPLRLPQTSFSQGSHFKNV
jgi:hypothetical protein